jgi:hypothetical protein
MSNKIILKKSSVGAKLPLTTDLEYGEVALNYADGKLYFKNSSNNIVFLGASSATETLTNKSVSLGSNTLTGTVAQFNSALTDGDFATLAGAETLTNKTLTNPVISGTLTVSGSTGANGYILTSTGTGMQWQPQSANTLDGLSDVVITSPEAQQVLKFNGSNWVNAESDAAVASAVFATNAESDLGLVTDLIIGIQEDLGFVTDVAAFIYNMGQLRVDGIVSLENLDQSVKADYIAYSIIFGF